MTTATLAAGNRTMTEVRPRRSLEELVDRLMAALFREEPEKATTETPSLSQSVHEARRLRQAGDPVSSTGQALDGALAVFAGMDMAKARRSRHVTPCASATRGARPASTCADDSRRQIAGRSLFTSPRRLTTAGLARSAPLPAGP